MKRLEKKYEFGRHFGVPDGNLVLVTKLSESLDPGLFIYTLEAGAQNSCIRVCVCVCFPQPSLHPLQSGIPRGMSDCLFRFDLGGI